MSLALQKIKQNSFAYLFILFAAIFLVNGYGVVDVPDFLTISVNPFQLLAPINRQFLYSSPINFFIAYFFDLDSGPGFFLIHGGEIIAALVCVGIAVRKKIADAKDQIRFISLLALTPLFFILTKWMGKVDPILLGGFSLCWAFPGCSWRVLVATIVVIAHREVGSLMCLSLYFLEEKKDHTLLLAIAGGNAMHLLYQYKILDTPPQSRPEVIASKGRNFLLAFSYEPALYIMSMFSWYWVLIVLKKPQTKEAIIIILAYCLALLNEDFTRDFILAVLPAIFFHIERVVRDPDFAAFEKLVPLSLLQFQVAAMGQVYMARNSFILTLFNRLHAHSH